jgi:hypothetical protein
MVDYRVDPDPLADWVMKATCVSGEERDCGEESPETQDQQEVTQWIARHRADTGHGRFEETYKRFVIATMKT